MLAFHIHAVRRCYASVSRLATSLKSSTEHLTGQSEVLDTQKLVRTRKDDLQAHRQQLAEASVSYKEVQERLKTLYAKKMQVYQSPRRDVATLQAVNAEEEELLVEEQRLHERLEEYVREERLCFERLGDAIVESHEKERAQSDRMKYYSRLGSLVGALLGFLGSNLFVRRDIRENGQIVEDRFNHLELSLKRIDDNHALTRSKLGVLVTDLRKEAAGLQRVCERLEARVQGHTRSRLVREGGSVEMAVTQYPPSSRAEDSSASVYCIGVMVWSVLQALLAVYGCR